MSNVILNNYEIGEGAFACGRRYLKNGKWVRPCESNDNITQWVQAVKEMNEENNAQRDINELLASKIFELEKRIEALEYSLSVSMCVHEDAEKMTGRERDELAMITLGQAAKALGRS